MVPCSVPCAPWQCQWDALHPCGLSEYLFTGFDQAGHGLSPGIPGYVASYTALIDDTVAFVKHVRSEYSAVNLTGIPVFLIGESMGGAVAIATAVSARVVLDGVLLLAPMCGMDPVSGMRISVS